MSWPAQHISISINRTPDKVYAYVANPENLPQWAAGLSGTIRRAGERWIADSPMGEVAIKFAPHNAFGVLDHDVTLPNGETVHNPMRVVRNDTESEVIFTLFHRPGMTQQDIQSDAAQVFEDLLKLKMILEERE
ncbi:SRPBCC family protein [Oligoflexus tunisiensis]|uniref:SRPBCC family protein n=1 Tax=Oligoflexus tunisiensis TaxID=708132 RepID=UPI000AED8A01|nr:SRPBCC family protein [Oligoflexus tunisiensis]